MDALRLMIGGMNNTDLQSAGDQDFNNQLLQQQYPDEAAPGELRGSDHYCNVKENGEKVKKSSHASHNNLST